MGKRRPGMQNNMIMIGSVLLVVLFASLTAGLPEQPDHENDPAGDEQQDGKDKEYHIRMDGQKHAGFLLFGSVMVQVCASLSVYRIPGHG